MIKLLGFLSGKWITNFFSTHILEVIVNSLKRFKTLNMKLKHFRINEFESPDKLGSGSEMDVDFLAKIDAARELAGIPFKINSGFRTQEHNLKVGGVYSSSHKKGLAVDISCLNSDQKYIILNSLMAQNLTRFGIGKTFIHVD